MIVSAASVLSLLLLAGLSLSASSPKPGTITAPKNGTAVVPGKNFTFSYQPHADYATSTFAYHVWLLAAPPGTHGAGVLSLTTPNVSGFYFGRFDYANYPAVKYPKDPAPPQLTLPDFSKSPGGFASGAHASNLPMQLTIIEEWGNGEAIVGRQLSVASTTLIYNKTTAK